MEIVLFKDITTESTIVGLEQLAKTYEGLYVDMSNAEERKYVKDKAHDIKFLLKTINAKRIAVSKEFKAKVEKEAFEIEVRLKAANEPFTLLIDEYNQERAKILADEKRLIEIREALVSIENDHEMALLMNKTWAFDRSEVLRLANEQAETLRVEADLRAEERQKQAILESLQQEKNAENARLADKEHVRGINANARKEIMASCDLTFEQAMLVVIAIAKNNIANVTINY